MLDLLIFSPTPTHPADAGNRTRIRQFLETINRAGIRFHLVVVRRERGDNAAMLAHWGEERCTIIESVEAQRKIPLWQRIRHRVYRLLRMSPPYIPWGIDDWCG